ncbi:hypothetical protein C8Q77DRAFT_380481 [Trametes polyzona]|nr:hypothetical protein C8Q77DRAFT_380481 [Trametes polyzona]
MVLLQQTSMNSSLKCSNAILPSWTVLSIEDSSPSSHNSKVASKKLAKPTEELLVKTSTSDIASSNITRKRNILDSSGAFASPSNKKLRQGIPVIPRVVSRSPIEPTTQPTNIGVAAEPRRPKSYNTDTRGLTASGTPWSATPRIAECNASGRPQRKTRALPPITEDSDIKEWKRVDDLLGTHVAPAAVLPKYAQAGRAKSMVHVPLQLSQFRKGSKGKQRAEPTLSETRWSNVGEFMERLERMFGPGEITRGMGRAPKNALRRPVREYAGETGRRDATNSDVAITQPSDTEEVSGEDGSGIGAAGAGRRGRLEEVASRKEDLHDQM